LKLGYAEKKGWGYFICLIWTWACIWAEVFCMIWTFVSLIFLPMFLLWLEVPSNTLSFPWWDEPQYPSRAFTWTRHESAASYPWWDSALVSFSCFC
jgi:hypothetical protein